MNAFSHIQEENKDEDYSTSSEGSFQELSVELHSLLQKNYYPPSIEKFLDFLPAPINQEDIKVVEQKAEVLKQGLLH